MVILTPQRRELKLRERMPPFGVSVKLTPF